MRGTLRLRSGQVGTRKFNDRCVATWRVQLRGQASLGIVSAAMHISTPLAVALLGALGTVIGYVVSNALERSRTLRLRELEFRLDRYKEFLLSFSEQSVNATFETQLRFANSVNVILMIGSAPLLNAVRDLVDNDGDEKWTAEKQQLILNRIVLQMRSDLNAPDSKQLAKFRFPIIVPDVQPRSRGKRQHTEPLR